MPRQLDDLAALDAPTPDLMVGRCCCRSTTSTKVPSSRTTSSSRTVCSNWQRPSATGACVWSVDLRLGGWADISALAQTLAVMAVIRC